MILSEKQLDSIAQDLDMGMGGRTCTTKTYCYKLPLNPQSS